MMVAVDTTRRRGACPALSAPMQTGDGLLVRLNPVSQGLTPKQLIGLCESAARNGNGILAVTARGSIQIRGLTEQSTSRLADDVNALSIAIRTGVPVETGPLAGLDANEIADPGPLAGAIRTAIADAGLSSRLGPKVSVVIEGGGIWRVNAISADVRCVAVKPDGQQAPSWRISSGGETVDGHVAGVFPEAEAARVCLGILERIARMGVHARARQLHLAEPSAVAHDDREPVPNSSVNHPPLGLMHLTTDRTALALALPFGSIRAETLIAFAERAEALGCTEIRPAPPRSLVVLGLDQENCETLQDKAGALGFVIDAEDPLIRVSACTGKPACASGHFETRMAALKAIEELRECLDAGLSLHVSGCSKGCAHPAPSAITLVGDENGTGLVVNGTARHTPLAYTQPDALGRSLHRLARLIGGKRGEDESMASRLATLDKASLSAAFRLDTK